MTNENTQIIEIGGDLYEIRKIEQPKEQPKQEPKDFLRFKGEGGWVIGSDGFKLEEYHDYYYNNYNLFQSLEQAELEQKKRLLWYEMREYVAQINGELDWHDKKYKYNRIRVGYGNSLFFVKDPNCGWDFDTKFKDRYNELYGTNY